MVDQVLALPEGTSCLLLAPVVRERKGEHLQVFESCARRASCARASTARGRARRGAEAGSAPEAHIEAVVDRFRVRPDLRSAWPNPSRPRCARRRHGARSGAAMDEPGRASHRPAVLGRFACPVCGYSVPELEPRLFSFNNPPAPARLRRPRRDQEFFDPARVVAHPELSLAGRRGARLGPPQRLLLPDDPVAGEALRLRPETPWQLTAGEDPRDRAAARQRRREDRVPLPDASGGGQAQAPFEGILPNLERRYRETESARCARNWPSTSARALPGLRRHAPEPRRAPRVRRRPRAARSRRCRSAEALQHLLRRP
jgi:excinuclease ABC subunit A